MASARAIQVLDCALALLSDPSKWVKGAYAVVSKTDKRHADYVQAGAFCLVGALRHCTLRGPDDNDYDFNVAAEAELIILDAINKTRKKRPYSDVIAFNDHDDRRHADIVTVLKRARQEASKA